MDQGERQRIQIIFMTQVSKYPLSKALEEQMFNLFFRSLADLRLPSDIKEFLDDLLSPTEKTMLAKRLAIAMLLVRNYDHRTIKQTLKVSLTTISKVRFWLKNQGKGYRMVIDKFLKEEKWDEFWQKMTDFIKEATDTKHRLPTSYHKPKGSLGEER